MELELPEVLSVSTYGYAALRPGIRAGELSRVRAGTYLPAADPGTPEWERRRTWALASCVGVARTFTTPFSFGFGTGAVLREWIDVLDDPRPHVRQGVNPGAGQPRDVVRHAVRDFQSEEITMINGLPVAPAVPTIVDCARTLAPVEALAVVDGAFRVEARIDKFHREESEARQAVLRDLARERLREIGAARGVRQARVILDLADGFAANPAESRMRWVALRYGLPVPICQYELWVDDQQYFADALWMAEVSGHRRPVIAEFDGALKYGGEYGAEVVVREKKREDAIRRRHRAEFGRLTWPTLLRPEAAFREILEAFPAGTVPALKPRPELALPRELRRRDRSSVPRS